MKNLQLLYCWSFSIPRGIFAIDADTGNVWLISECLKLFSFRELGVICREHADLAMEASLESCRDIVSLDFVLDLESAYFALKNGEIYKFSVESGELDNVGSVACGLECAVWSPDQEILVLVSKEGKVIMLSKNCDPISEFSLLTGDFGEASPVVLGWGKRETQFKGKAGKFADLEGKDGQESVGILPNDDRRVIVSWRGDGQFFAVSFIHESKCVREVKIFTRECLLHATSESVAGLGQSLSWKPSVNLITSNRTSHKEEIVFFEKNGLRYGEFTLPYPVGEYAVREVAWNYNSSILLVLLAPLARNTNTLLQLWTCSNAHWYLKQEISFSAVNTPTFVQWNAIQTNTLHILTQSGSFLTYELMSVAAQSSEISSENDNWLAVIDGSHLLLSPYRDLTVPPPMHSCSVELNRSVIEVAFGRGELRGKLLCLLADFSVVELVHSRSEGGRCDSGFLDKTGSYSISKIYHFRDLSTADITYHKIRHLHWVSDRVLLAMFYDSEGKEHKIVLFKILTEENEIITVSTLVTAKPILTLAPGSTGHSFAVEFSDGEVNRVTCSNELISTEPWVNLPYPSNRIAIATFAGKEHVLGFTNNGRLFIDEFELCSNATSYFLHSNFLLLTTSNHYLHSLPLSVPLSEMHSILPAQSQCTSDAVRRVERGAQIVTAVSFGSKVVLQMPRGNLEAIHPRALILTIIGNLLDSREYAAAFTALRRHRINLNVFHDYHPEMFRNSIHEFITQVHRPQFLNIFITELSDQDICSTMYPSMKRDKSDIGTANKVNSVCDIIIEACEKTENPHLYTLPILTALIKKSPSRLEEVLLRIKRIPGNSGTSQEDALKYVSLLIDMQQLYSVALGTYDFEVMLLVAQLSKMDPKEYLPFLNSLKSLEESYRKYSIDCHLSKYDSALLHILQCRDREEECLSFITKHELYKRALEEMSGTGDKLFVSVSLAYGDWLFSKEKYSEAGIVFIQVGELQLALKAFRKSNNWQRVLSIAHQLNLPRDAVLEIVYEQVIRLRDGSDYVTASRVLCEYTQDYEDAILMLIEANVFSESYRLIHKYSRMDLLETHLKPRLVESAKSIISMLIKSRADVEKFVDRMDVVLTRKLEKEQNYFEEGGNLRDQDFFSEQSSVTGQSQTNSVNSKGSRGSARSSRSSKNRKKLERKKYKLKEGSSHEDLALLQEIRDTVVSVDQIQDELSTTLDLLIISNEVTLARDLQSTARSTLTYLAATIPHTWYKHRVMTVALALCQEEVVVSSTNLCTGILGVLKEGNLFLKQTDTEISEPVVRSIKWDIGYLLSS